MKPTSLIRPGSHMQSSIAAKPLPYPWSWVSQPSSTPGCHAAQPKQAQSPHRPYRLRDVSGSRILCARRASSEVSTGWQVWQPSCIPTLQEPIPSSATSPTSLKARCSRYLLAWPSWGHGSRRGALDDDEKPRTPAGDEARVSCFPDGKTESVSV
ncbi:hypothetical protein GE21DRAFT_3650 [Neurospora crassa]|uniref:Uncharacterized protein n=1 Tax=Neurospora crassa (strain ATCC 24698 / 74-OR23-1A / CBS 708.71 / DSM 1257 / FGSC 987) TaxID=367110 RepID=V5INS6_NEUCR|nr:hypothetical protein NCU10246 [Neurospora crassa OR74A]ESA43717.1 hypothetical protein NCU10246 [Neurospora crassa OR74A]KHE82408.1 hypothetical protein GE21DRAFT_3650 [Neurospora crassa]|eukprot:XP_011393651.1 hypothetical protein NCU10246 [Neurospora crassa OR74A]